MKSVSIKFMLLFSISIMLLFSCNSKKELTSTSKSTPTAPQIIFLNYMVTRTADATYKARLINKIITDGKLKPSVTDDKFTTGDFVCVELDKASKSISSTSYINPLTRTVEYVTDQGDLGKLKMALDSAQLNIRMQLNPKTRSIALDQIVGANTKNTRLLTTLIK